MIRIWYGILAFVFTTYVILDGRNFGAGALQWIVAKTAAERRQVSAVLGPIWSWDEVWLVALAGVSLIAFHGSWRRRSPVIIWPFFWCFGR